MAAASCDTIHPRQALPQPVGKVRLHRSRHFAAREGLDARDEFRIPVQRASRKAEHAHQRGDGQITRRRAARGSLQGTLAAQDGERRFRDKRPVLLAEIAMAAEVGRQRLVGGSRELQQFGKSALDVPEPRGCRGHCSEIFVASWSRRVPSLSTMRTRTGR